MTEPNYQKPPLREEIEEFFKQVKGVMIAIIGLASSVAICVGIYKFSRSDIGEQIRTYINEHIAAFMFTTMIAFLSYLLLYFALESQYLIYKRYRLGYFSQMMWCFIGFFIVQLGNIPIALYMDGLIAIIIIDLLILGFTICVLSNYKKERPLLVRPLTEEENKLRKDIINALLNSYRIGPGDIKTDAKAFARACYLMDFYPELFNMITAPNAGFTIPSVFYSATLENPQNKLFIDIEDPRYGLYHTRIYRSMERDRNPEISYRLNSKNAFD